MQKEKIGPGLKQIRKQLLDEFSKIDKRHEHFKSDADSWSAVEIADHLYKSERRINSAIVQLIRYGKTGESKFVKTGKSENKVEDFTFNAGMSLDPAENTEPDNSKSLAEQIDALNKMRTLTEERLAEALEMDLEDAFIEHRYFGPLNIYDWLYFISKHEEIHLEQLRKRVLNKIEM
jgi:hypothetical protein